MKLERLGPYKLEKIIGRGGMGAVYVGLNDQSGERAAVKVLNPVLADDQSFRERFKAEVETLKKLLHPNIVQLFGYGEQDDYLFYVMELVEGRSLHDELLSGRRFQWREVSRIGIDVASALKHAHDRGVIHRDLKPANLLVDSQERVKLTDFGIAKLYGGTQLTLDGGVLGTADYMSPEQAEGRQVTSRCDLYSLGSVLFALLTGRPPFAGKSLPEVIQGLRFEKPIAVRRLNPDVPEEFESIISQLLEKDPQSRIPTAMALAHRLKAMDHALSLETRIDLNDDQGPLAENPVVEGPRTPLGVTVPLPIQTSFSTAVRPTMPLPAIGEIPGKDELAGNDGTGIAAPAAKLPASVTQARDGTRAEGAAAPEEVVEPSPKKTVFTTVTQAELRHTHDVRDADEHPLAAWLKIGGLIAAVLLLAAAFVYYATRPPSADALYARIQAAEEEGIEQLAGMEPEIARFREAFPNDPRRDELKQLQEEIDLHRLQRRLELRARRGDAASRSPIEQAYLEAVRLSASDPEAALAKFQALVDVFGSGKEQGKNPQEQRTNSQCLDLARRQIERLTKTVSDAIEAQTELLQARLKKADELAPGDPAAARKIWQGIVRLYGGKEWARELVDQAQAKLQTVSAERSGK